MDKNETSTIPPKVLVVSHNVFGPDNSMGKTLIDYFKTWPKEKLCQLYVHSEVPTTHLCEQYYRVTDMDMVKAPLRFKKPGTVLTANDIQEERAKSRTDEGLAAQIYQKGRARKPWMYLGRNLLWRTGWWKSEKLNAWVRECAPDVIFYAAGDYVFSFEIALYLSETFHLPMVISVMDDYYFFRRDRRGVLARWNTMQYRKTVEKAMEKAKAAFYIHPAMQQKYQEKFPLPSEVLYKGSPINDREEPDYERPVVSYFGSLGLNREKALIEIGQALKEVVPDGSVLLDVYSAESRPEILAELTADNGINFKGACSAKEVAGLQAKSNILVLAEADEPEIVEQVRFSLSTKVPEYLGSGRCILAYGNEAAGTVSYLQQNKVACVVTHKSQLPDALRQILSSKELRQAHAKKQKDLLETNHSEERNTRILQQVLCSVVTDLEH